MLSGHPFGDLLISVLVGILSARRNRSMSTTGPPNVRTLFDDSSQLGYTPRISSTDHSRESDVCPTPEMC
jgi:hypothetical protein